MSIKKFTVTVIGIMLFIVTGVIPLIVRAAVRPVPPELWDLLNIKTKADAFTYWKSVFLIASAAVILCASALNTEKNPLKKPAIPTILLCVYFLLVFLSDILSPYPSTAFFGTVERFEGFFAQAAYMIVFFASVRFSREPVVRKGIFSGLIFSSLITGAVGISQLLGHDFFATELGCFLVTGAPGRLSPAFTESYGTLFQPNTFGLYTAMLSPLLLLFGFSYEGKPFVKVLLLAAGAAMLVCNHGSGTLGGFAGMLTAAAVILITCAARKAYWQKKQPRRHSNRPRVKYILIFLTALPIGAFFYFNNPALPVQLFSEISALRKSAPSGEGNADTRTQLLFKDGVLKITRGGETLFSLTGSPEGRLLVVNHEMEEVLPVSASTSQNGSQTEYGYSIEGYGDFSVTQRLDYYLFQKIRLSASNGKLTVLWSDGAPVNADLPVPATGFKGNEDWGSGRGYIWSRAIPLALAHSLLGSGSDSFINEFPQHDVIGKANVYGDPYIMVDKAHNLYIQTFVTTGGVSALALILLFGHYLFTAFISLIKSNEPPAAFWRNLAILSSVAAFAASSLSTDSTIGSSGVFWVILGLGYAMNSANGGLDGCV
ncbi:MAG: O-antigen ligase family protein [Clostridiales bacterium]|nr:O-antigen ligase family protein [Clostridiales bacterium]